MARTDLAHRQIISREGYISHSPFEIFTNTVDVMKKQLEQTNIDIGMERGIGISNQRETTVVWNRKTGIPVCDAIVWQCARAKECCEVFDDAEREYIAASTGIPLSPYFPAAKAKWILEHYPKAKEMNEKGELCIGTIDSWLLYCLTDGKEFRTDYSNASRTQLLNLHSLKWDEKICDMFGISTNSLPEICDSNAWFGDTTVSGLFHKAVPIHSMVGDSHGALYGQGCHREGMLKATYGTGSSLMLNTGKQMIASKQGIVTSLAWSMNGKVDYVLEGNLNYTGAVITWLKEELKLLESAGDTEELAKAANQDDSTYLVPAFSGLGAPYWKSDAKAILYGMSRTTGRKEIVKAAVECIAYQINDIVQAMKKDAEMDISILCVDGGPTRNRYLMQFQSNISNMTVKVPRMEELSGIGAAYMAGIATGLFPNSRLFPIFNIRSTIRHLTRIREFRNGKAGRRQFQK